MIGKRKASKVSNRVVSTSKDTDWFASLSAGSLAEKTSEEFLAWLEQDPDHGKQYERCELVWARVGELEQDVEIADCIKECEERIEKYRNRTSIWTPFIFGVREMMVSPITKLSTLAVCFVFTFSWIILQIPKTYESGVGERSLVTLEDGSSITLNTNTRLAVRYSTSHRRIELEKGEAIFNVRHDPGRPFEVVAGNGIARAVGTRYNVEMVGDVVTVSVLEGSVEVRPDVIGYDALLQGAINQSQQDEPVVLKQGQEVNYWDEGIDKPSGANLERINAWLEGKLYFDANPLSEVIKEHNRYSSQKIIIAHDQLQSLVLSGVFNAGDTEALLFALNATFGIKARHRDGLILLFSKS